MNSTLEAQLAEAGIHGPGSKDLEQYERHLIRFFEREYKRILENPSSLESIGMDTTKGPMMEETEKLMEHHYDERPEFFNSFLDKSFRAYSMAYYGDTPDEIMNSTATLEEAQRAKFALIAKRAQIKGNEKILNIGCGFGSLETYLLKEFPSLEIVAITPSSVQAKFIRDRMDTNGDILNTSSLTLIEDKFDIFCKNNTGKHEFDIVMSVAVFEQALNMQDILEQISLLLKSNGRSFHHFITSKAPIPKFTDPTKTRIGNYFPGGRVWPHHEFARHTKHLRLENLWEVNGLNYWRTLCEWHNRYWQNLDKLYGTVYDIEAIAHWNNYFSLCKVVFAPLNGTFYGNSHYLFRKPT